MQQKRGAGRRDQGYGLLFGSLSSAASYWVLAARQESWDSPGSALGGTLRNTPHTRWQEVFEMLRVLGGQVGGASRSPFLKPRGTKKTPEEKHCARGPGGGDGPGMEDQHPPLGTPSGKSQSIPFGLCGCADACPPVAGATAPHLKPCCCSELLSFVDLSGLMDGMHQAHASEGSLLSRKVSPLFSLNYVPRTHPVLFQPPFSSLFPFKNLLVVSFHKKPRSIYGIIHKHNPSIPPGAQVKATACAQSSITGERRSKIRKVESGTPGLSICTFIVQTWRRLP